MFIAGILCLLLSMIDTSTQAPPFIDEQPIVWNLSEDAPDDTLIGCVKCIHPTTISVTITSVAVTQGPSSTKCTTCFSTRKLSPVSDYCVFYNSNPTDTLDFTFAASYDIEVECKEATEFARAILDIRIVPNAAPIFTVPMSATCASPIDAVTTMSNVYVYEGVAASDANPGDNIVYTMTSTPANDVFSIEPSTGKIYTSLPVSRFCHHTVIFYVTISDTKAPPTGPLVITCAIANYYRSPMVSNTNRDYNVDESLAVTDTVYTFLTPASPLTVTYSIDSVQPLSANSLFTITGDELQVASTLDYEDAFRRDPNITIIADNGICPPEEYYLHVHIRDQNDAPQVVPKSYTHTQQEGGMISFNLDTTLTISDEDVEDGAFDYSITAGNPGGLWTVTGTNNIASTVAWDYEVHGTGASLTMEVADRKGPASDTFNVTIFVTDINDNAPMFTSASFPFTVSECTPAGTVLGQVMATDADTAIGNNNVIVYETVNMNDIGVNAGGQVTLLNPLTVGMTPSVMVGANDLGTPPLTSPWKTTVSLTVIAGCPSTTTAPPAACDNSQSGGGGGADYSSNWWTQIATLLAAIMSGNN